MHGSVNLVGRVSSRALIAPAVASDRLAVAPFGSTESRPTMPQASNDFTTSP